MTDTELRSAERRAHDDHATVQDRTAHLIGRLRAGSLSRERLDLAAYCGDEAALLAGGAAAPDVADTLLFGLAEESLQRLEARLHRRLRWWAVGLRRWGADVWSCALTEALRVWSEARQGSADMLPLDDVLTALGVWGACPCVAHATSLRERLHARAPRDRAAIFVRDVVLAIEAPSEPLRVGPFADLDRARHVGRAASIAGGLLTLDDDAGLPALLVHDSGPRHVVVMGALHSGLAGERVRPWLGLESLGAPFDEAARVAGEQVVRERLCRRLVAHALG